MIIEGMRKDTAHVVQAMDSEIVEVRNGIQIVGDSGAAFANIAASLQHIADQVQEVSAVSQQIAAGSEQVTASVDEMSGIAKDAALTYQQVVSSSERQLEAMNAITSSASSLGHMAEQLQSLIGKFKV